MMKIYRRLDTVRKLCTLFLLCLFELLLPNSLAAQNTVIKAGHLFNSRTGEFSQDQTIIVKEGKIVAVGKDLPYSHTDTLIDLSNAWVLPGLIDCHVHLTTNFPYRNLSIAQAYTTESSSLALVKSLVQRLIGGLANRHFLHCYRYQEYILTPEYLLLAHSDGHLRSWSTVFSLRS